MEMEYYKAESLDEPKMIDEESSRVVTYIRKNLQTHQEADENSDTTHTVYTYDEAKIPKKDYTKYLLDRQRADIDYIALMTDVDLEVE